MNVICIKRDGALIPVNPNIFPIRRPHAEAAPQGHIFFLGRNMGSFYNSEICSAFRSNHLLLFHHFVR